MLAALQQAFYEALVAPPAAREPFAWVARQGALSPADRVCIYADQYFFRSADALAVDFPKVAALLGNARFRRCVAAYVQRHPSEDPSLGRLGRHFPGFLGAWTGRQRADLSALAQLEWARDEAYLAADSPVLSVAELRALSPEAWATSHLHLVPSARRLQGGFAVRRIWQALEEGRRAPPLFRRPEHLLVWRKAGDVFHVEVSADESEALARAEAGQPLPEICAAFASQPDPARAAFAALSSWVQEGMVAAVVLRTARRRRAGVVG